MLDSDRSSEEAIPLYTEGHSTDSPRTRPAKAAASVNGVHKKRRRDKRTRYQRLIDECKLTTTYINQLINRKPSTDFYLAEWLYESVLLYQEARWQCAALVNLSAIRREENKKVDWMVVDELQYVASKIEPMFFGRCTTLLKLIYTPIGSWKPLGRELGNLERVIRKPNALVQKETVQVVSSICGCLEFWGTLSGEDVLPQGRIRGTDWGKFPLYPSWISEVDSRRFRN